MKLLMISGDRSLAAGRRGAFAEMLEEFSGHWERIDILCPRPAKPAKDNALIQSLQARNIFVHPSPWGLLRQSHWIARRGEELVAQHRHDVATVQEFPPFYNGLGARKLAKATGIPFVLEVHHIVGFPRASSVSERIGYVLSRLYLKRDASHAAGVRVVNATTQALLAQWGVPPEKISVVPSFYLRRLLFEKPGESRVTSDVCTSGRMVKNKGVADLLRVIARVGNCRARIIGDGPLRHSLERLARRLKIADRVAFAGWRPRAEDVIEEMRSARIFVMNSRSEGGPRTALEAMACGLPVIATRVGVMPEVIRDGENGFLTDGTPDDLARKICVLLNNAPLCEQMGKAARGILDRFDSITLIARYADFLKSHAHTSA